MSGSGAGVTAGLPTGVTLNALAGNYAGTFSDFGAPNRAGGYYKLQGRVYLLGSAKNAGADGTLTTLPAAYRPTATVMQVVSTNTGPVDLTVSAAGVVSVPAAIYARVSLDGAQWLVG